MTKLGRYLASDAAEECAELLKNADGLRHGLWEDLFIDKILQEVYNVIRENSYGFVSKEREDLLVARIGARFTEDLP